MSVERLVEILESMEQRAGYDERIAKSHTPAASPGYIQSLSKYLHPWQLPDDLIYLMKNGGFWPGGNFFPGGPGCWHSDQDDSALEVKRPAENPRFALRGEMFEEMVNDTYPLDSLRTVRWFEVGTTWERDHCYLPLLTSRAESAPIGVFSSQMLTVKFAAPSIASFLEAYMTCIELLTPVNGDDNTIMFVDFIADPPLHLASETQNTSEVRDVLASLVSTWSSDHRTWDNNLMPTRWTETQDIDQTIVSKVLGVE